MEKREFYTVKDIIFGLRNEYQNNENELATLKNYCTHNKKEVVAYNFSLSKEKGKKFDIVCYYQQRENFIEKILRESNVFVNVDNIVKVVCTKDNNDWYYILNSRYGYQAPVSILPNKNYKFCEQATRILTSDFCQNISSEIELNNKEAHYKIRLNPHMVDLCVLETENLQFTNFCYNSILDSITVGITGDRKVSNELIEKILAIKFPSQSLSPYHISMIDESAVNNKQIVLNKFDSKNNKQAKFSLKEEDNQIVLSKVKRK